MTLVLYILGITVANIIQGITGFAGNVLAMPPSVMLLGVDTARGSLNVISIFSGIFTSIWFRKHIKWRELGKMLLLVMPGIIVGLWVYDYFPSDNLLIAYGAVIAAIGIWYLRGAREKPIPKPVMLLIILAAGIMQGMFVSGGPLLVIYAVTVLRDKEDFRATLSVVWLVLNAIIFVQGLLAGTIASESVDYALIGIGPVLAATVVGGLLQKKINQHAFMKLTYALLIVSGAALVLNAVM